MDFPAIPKTLTAVIARRTLIFVTKAGRQRVSIRIGKPVRDVRTAGGLDWRCPVAITGSSRRALRGIGVDSLQAVIHALKLVEIEITAQERERKGRFEWLGRPWHGTLALDVAPSNAQRKRTNKRQKSRTRA